jgi:hypothetical protein
VVWAEGEKERVTCSSSKTRRWHGANQCSKSRMIRKGGLVVCHKRRLELGVWSINKTNIHAYQAIIISKILGPSKRKNEIQDIVKCGRVKSIFLFFVLFLSNSFAPDVGRQRGVDCKENCVLWVSGCKLCTSLLRDVEKKGGLVVGGRVRIPQANPFGSSKHLQQSSKHQEQHAIAQKIKQIKHFAATS